MKSPGSRNDEKSSSKSTTGRSPGITERRARSQNTSFAAESRSTNSIVRLSGETVHDSARLGAIAVPGTALAVPTTSYYNSFHFRGLPNASVASDDRRVQ